MSIEAAYIETAPALRRRLERMTGDPQTAEDLCQETFARAWTAAPREAAPAVLSSWLHVTARNLAVDELRRRSRRDLRSLADVEPEALAVSPEELPLAQAALAELTPHERFLLLLRYQAGLSLSELARLLDVSDEATRKRVARAAARFRAAHARHAADPAPLVLLVVRDSQPGPYRSWLESAGARVHAVSGAVEPRDLLRAEALVLSGSHTDIHPATYGERPRVALNGRPDARRDRRDIAALRAALASGVPIVGVCRGHQLLNLLAGGTLFQDLSESGARPEHSFERHDVHTARDSAARSLLGIRASVDSDHHQGIRRLGRGLRAGAVSPDGVVESVELTGRGFALGVQWHPQEHPEEPGSGVLAETLVQRARSRRFA